MESANTLKEIQLTELIDAYKGASVNKKYVIFFDSTGGNAATFFQYKGLLKDFNKEMMKIEAGKKTIKDACNVFRDGLVGTM